MLEAISLTISHNAVTSGQGQYSAISIGGEESLTWGLNLGLAKGGIQDITGSVGIASGSFSFSANVANRPKLELHDFDGREDGKFLAKSGQLEDLPSNIFWLTLSWGGVVTE